MSFRDFEQLITTAGKMGRRTVAVARAEDPVVLESLVSAEKEGLVEPVLYGDKERIIPLMAKVGAPDGWSVIHVDGDDAACAAAAVGAVRRGEADLIMKGHLHTAVLFKAALDKENGLERSGVLSHIVFIETGFYHKLFAMTDGGMNRAPDYDTKVAIARNAIGAFHRLGYECPKVALLSYVEKASKSCQETSDWARLVEEAPGLDLGSANVEGPMAMDLCLSEEAKRVKEYGGEVSGDADIIVVPSITSCNAPAKAFFLCGATAAGVVIGASSPIIALSRGDSARTRMCSIALAGALLGSDETN